MSEEDGELKELLVRTLTETGILSRLKAQLCAAVFLALEKHDTSEGLPSANHSLRALLSSENGVLLMSLIVDFLRRMNLVNTLSVLETEAELKQRRLLDSKEMLCALSLPNTNDVPTADPILLQALSTIKMNNGYLYLDKVKTSDRTGDLFEHRIGTKQNATVDIASSPDHSSWLLHHNQLDSRNSQHEDTVSGTTGLFLAQSKQPTDNQYILSNGSPNLDGPQSNSSSSSSPVNRNFTSKSVVKLHHSSQPRAHNVGNSAAASRYTSPSSPRDSEHPDYQEDFDSPRSQGTISAYSFGGDDELKKLLGKGVVSQYHEENEDVTSGHSPRYIPSSQSHDSRDPFPGSGAISGSSSRVRHVNISVVSPTPNPSLIAVGDADSSSRSISPSVLRVYPNSKKRSVGDECNSDVDDVEDDEIPEVFDGSAGDEETVDRTIDSEQSLGLDYVEEVRATGRTITSKLR